MVSKKIPRRGSSPQFFPAPTRSYPERASTMERRLELQGGRVRTTESTESTEQDNTGESEAAQATQPQDSAGKPGGSRLDSGFPTVVSDRSVVSVISVVHFPQGLRITIG